MNPTFAKNYVITWTKGTFLLQIVCTTRNAHFALQFFKQLLRKNKDSSTNDLVYLHYGFKGLILELSKITNGCVKGEIINQEKNYWWYLSPHFSPGFIYKKGNYLDRRNYQLVRKYWTSSLWGHFWFLIAYMDLVLLCLDHLFRLFKFNRLNRNRLNRWSRQSRAKTNNLLV